MQESYDIDKLIQRGQSELAPRIQEFIDGGYVISAEEPPEQADPNVREFDYKDHKVRIVTMTR